MGCTRRPGGCRQRGGGSVGAAAAPPPAGIKTPQESTAGARVARATPPACPAACPGRPHAPPPAPPRRAVPRRAAVVAGPATSNGIGAAGASTALRWARKENNPRGGGHRRQEGASGMAGTTRAALRRRVRACAACRRSLATHTRSNGCPFLPAQRLPPTHHRTLTPTAAPRSVAATPDPPRSTRSRATAHGARGHWRPWSGRHARSHPTPTPTPTPQTHRLPVPSLPLTPPARTG